MPFRNGLFFFLLLFFVTANSKGQIYKNERGYYFADRFVVKFRTEKPTLRKTASKQQEIKNPERFIKKIKSVFPDKPVSSPLSKIKVIEVNAPVNITNLINEYKIKYDVEWAEPYFLYETTYVPNDPKYADSTLLHLYQIEADKAWDISKGSPDIVIGIIDTGIDWDHPDLAANIWMNDDEIPGNGVDDDNNGYVDDVRGWDFGGIDGTPDNDPVEDKPDHGTLVAGIASAVTDNSIGISSIGFNTKLMAVKTSQDNLRSDVGTALISHGYEGIVYAVDNGAKIINCSWGGYNYSSMAQEIINYAVGKGVLIVAAAGNDNRVDPFYPASYKGVLSVGATNYVDQKASFSNYGKKIDVVAPGVSIYSTWQDDTYKSTSGTSMSSPLVAGLAALTAHVYPNYNPLQIGEQIRTNTTNIDSINPGVQYLFGSGRINAYNTLSNGNSKSVRVIDFVVNDLGDGDGLVESGEKVSIELFVTNYLKPLSNLTVEIINQPSFAGILNGTSSLGGMQTLETRSNDNQKLEIVIDSNTPPNTDIDLLLGFSDGEYDGFQWITISANPTYANQDINNLVLTLTSNGSLGFNDFPNNTEGEGLIYMDDNNVLFEGALIYGTSENQILNCARNFDATQKDNDFGIVQPLLVSTPGTEADQQSFAVFSENVSNGLGITTEFHSYAFAGSPDENFIILRYKFFNGSGNTISNFYAGIYFDLDMDENDWDGDIVKFDTINNFGYFYDEDANPTDTKIGVALVSSEKFNFYAMDQNGDNGGIVSWDGFSDAEKWTAISSGLSVTEAGPSDISAVISAGPFTFNPGDTVDVAFSVCGAKTLDGLRSNIIRSRNVYIGLPSDIKSDPNKLLQTFVLHQNYPNPFGRSGSPGNSITTIKYTAPSLSTSSLGERTAADFHITLKVYDVLGREVATLVDEKQSPGTYKVRFKPLDLPSGIYFYTLRAGKYLQTKKMVLLR